MTENTGHKRSSSNLSKLNFVLIVIIAAVALFNESEQLKKLYFLHQAITSKYTVDFTVSDIQRIDDVFLLANASQEKHLTGIKFSGRVINSQSVDYIDVAFNLSVDGESKEFTINRISSGNSTGFNVYIPELSIDDARYAKIEYVRSRIHFYTK
jgi:hypothetical protein